MGARLLLIAVIGLAACSPAPPTPSPSLTPPLAPTASASTEPSPSPSPALSQVVVRQRQIDVGFYTEGAVAYVEIYGSEGELVRTAETPDYHLDVEILRTALVAGRYELRTYVRPCAAACPAMDAPTDACSVELNVAATNVITVSIGRRVGRPCSAVVEVS